MLFSCILFVLFPSARENYPSACSTHHTFDFGGTMGSAIVYQRCHVQVSNAQSCYIGPYASSYSLFHTSMFPLLKRENLTLPYYLVTILWNYVAGYHTLSMPKVVQLMASICYTAILAWHVAESYIPPPQSLPDLYTVLNVLFSCGCFLLAFAYFYWRQFKLEDSNAEISTEQKKKQH
jgi:hypothetical protein